MTLDQTIIQKASGENRLDPDQQRRYLGTFAERVVLLASLADAHHPNLIKQLPDILSSYDARHQPLALKLSSQMDSSAQMTYLKTAQHLNLPATIVTEEKATSPYGFVLHTDHAVDLDAVDITSRYPGIFEKQKEASAKKSWWQKLFR